MSHGDHWAALIDDLSLLPTTLLPRIVEQGQPYDKGVVAVTGDDGVTREEFVFALRYPAAPGPLSYLALCAIDASAPERVARFVTAYPFVYGGTESTLELCRILPGDIPQEATLELATEEGARIFAFDPLYFRDHRLYRVGEKSRFILSGLAYTLDFAPAQHVDITAGPLLELERRRRLEEDPAADVAAVESVRLHLHGMRSFIPVEDDPSSASFRSPIESVSWWTFEGRSFVRLGIRPVEAEDGKQGSIGLYAPADRLGGHVPQVGDEVEGVMWVQARRIG